MSSGSGRNYLEGLRGDDHSFADVINMARETCEEVFTTGAKEALVEGKDWTWEEELELLKEEAKIVSGQCRKMRQRKCSTKLRFVPFRLPICQV